MAGIEEIYEWLVSGAPGAPTPMHLIARAGPELLTLGFPIARVEAFVRTLHPHIVGRTFLWLASEGYTDFHAGPLRFMSGQFHAISFATRAKGGFDDHHIVAIDRLLKPLARVAEIFAIFPIGEPGVAPGPVGLVGGASKEDQCDRALEAAHAAYESLGRQNERRAVDGKPAVRFGLALHVGEVTYGNIGGSERLDFTCIGPAVNLASRLEGLTGRLSRQIVVSREFAEATRTRTVCLGEFILRGVRDPVAVFTPAEPETLTATAS